jgi:hypothetical protein
VHVARIGAVRDSYRNLFGNPEGRRSFGGPRQMSEDNIKNSYEY